MVGHARRLRGAQIAAVLGVAIAIASCATTPQGVSGSVGGAPPAPTPKTATQERRTYYAGIEGLKVYSEPSATSTVLGTLSQNEKVTRSKLERGYAFVESAKNGLTGWVDNAQLIWRLPTGPGTGAPTHVEAEPEEPEAPAREEPSPPAAPQPTPAPAAVFPTMVPAPTAAPRSLPTPRPVGPSIFNPY